jgi:Fic family protein
VQYQIKNHVFGMDEITARFHHILVYIHPFSNGNGRHARLISDIVLLSQNYKRFTWGSSDSLTDPSQNRKNYIDALRAADRFDYSLLMEFVRH